MHIKKLRIRRYRGIENLVWEPLPGINCLIGPADSGKSTVLSAISLLLAPYSPRPPSEFDYFRRRVTDEFEIKAVIGGLDVETLAKASGVLPTLWSWKGGELTPLPDQGEENVLICRVRGTADMETVHELVFSGGEEHGEHTGEFSAGLRRALRLARLSDLDRAARDLRITPGSLLTRQLGKVDLRPALHAAVGQASTNLGNGLPEEAAERLKKLSELFGKEKLPPNLHLGIVPPLGSGLSGMVSLMVGDNPEEAIPIFFAGQGTRQLALLAMSADQVAGDPILVADELERGLEPYRQRVATERVARLIGGGGQAFLTTHAPAVLRSVPEGTVWRLFGGDGPVPIADPLLIKVMKEDPEAFFAPVPIFCEGWTEIGLLQVLLPHYTEIDLDAAGIRLIEMDKGGQPQVIDAIKAAATAGIAGAAFLDNEDAHTGRRKEIQGVCVLFVWQGVKDIEEAVCTWLPLPQLLRLFIAAMAATGVQNVGSLVSQVQDHIPEDERQDGLKTPANLSEAYPENLLRTAIRGAMSGKKLDSEAIRPGKAWFKSIEGGRILAGALLEGGLPAQMEAQLKPFADSVKELCP